jgi:enamine deaminase RidA (YjgF/YER057c/UK114 family)
MENVVRVHYILPNIQDFYACKDVINQYLGKVCPAATVFEAKLLNEKMKIEIEITAVKPQK